jgi:ABC-type antimicrobial peptide transport system permease subunit
MRIGELARKGSVNIQTIRFYERPGLFPAPSRGSSGYRCYEAHDLERLIFIKGNHRLGFTLDEIKNRVPFVGMGVLSERGQGLDVGNEDDQVYVPLATAMHRLMNLDHYNAMVFEMDSPRSLSAAAIQMRSLMRTQHHIRATRSDDFQIQNQKTLLDTQTAAAARLNFFLLWIGASALTISGLGIVAITWMAVKERTREIGNAARAGRHSQRHLPAGIV